MTCLCLEAKGEEEGDGSHGTRIGMVVDYHVPGWEPNLGPLQE